MPLQVGFALLSIAESERLSLNTNGKGAAFICLCFELRNNLD